MNEKYSIKIHWIAIRLLLCAIFIVLFSQVQSQDTSSKSIELPEFSVSEKLNKMFSMINTHKIDSDVMNMNSSNSLASLLSKNSGVTVNSYGVTGISSVSMRGGNANHTAVLWNGFNLQDPLNGGYNFSSSSVNFIDEVNIQYGGGSSAYGSGAIGGTIHLNNKPLFNKKLFGSAHYKTGSYGLNFTRVEIGHGNDKFSTRLRLFNYSIANDFEFKNVAKIGKPVEKYINSKMEQYGLLHEMYYKLKRNQTISSQFWYQHNDREIPPNTTGVLIENTENSIKDEWYRWALNWNKTGNKIDYETRTGFFFTEMNYINSSIDLNDTHHSFKNISEALATINFLKAQKITLGLINNYTNGTSDNFEGNPSLNTTAIYLSPSFSFFKKLTLNLNVREEYHSNDLKPLTYSINNKYNFYKDLFLTASFSKNHRTPNFNDLFWNAGFAKGNLNLEDEYGYSKDIGLELKHYKEKTNIKSSLSFYQNIINNQIQWISEGQLWTPKNIKLVNTKGVEFTLVSDYKITNKTKFIFNLSYTYTDSQVKEKSINESDDVLNKQLIYIPYYQSNSLIGLKYKNVVINTNIQYVGYQFTTADNLDWIESYLLTDIGAQYILKIKKNNIVLSGKAKNVFDTKYEERQWYPMPGMNYEIGIKVIIN